MIKRFRRTPEVESASGPAPDPSPDGPHPIGEEPSVFGTLFDPDHYRKQIVGGPELNGSEALEHFLTVGWTLGFDPSAEFSTDGYLSENPDVEAAGLNPLSHYVSSGRVEGRPVISPSTFISRDHWAADRQAAAAAIEKRRVDLSRYLDSLGFGIEPVDLVFPHEMSGLDEADPEWFDREFYLALNPDVRASGLDPLAHFMHGGFRGNRLPSARRVAARFQPISDVDRVLAARSRKMEEVPGYSTDERALQLSGDQVLTSFRSVGFTEQSELVIAFGHDDYGTSVGGIQLCAGFEQERFNRSGATYAYIFPSESRSSLRPLGSGEGLVRCRINGTLVPGTFKLSDLVDALVETSSGRLDLAGIVKHSMLGHEPERVADAIRRLSPRRMVWWVHDYSAHCANHLLLRNGVNPCGDPKPASQSCGVCSFGHDRAEHVRRIRLLLDAFDWEVCAPSESAAEASINGATPLPERPRVVPHGRLVGTADAASRITNEGRVRIAFVGHPAFHKGWDAFLEFSRSPSAELFEFFHFGVDDRSYQRIEFVRLEQQSGNLGVATDLLVEFGIEAVFNWPRWKETFNFVNYESLAAGCLVITNPDSGHVVDAAIEANRGIVFASMEELLSDAGLAGRIRSHHRDVPRQVMTFEMTGLSPSVIAVNSRENGRSR